MPILQQKSRGGADYIGIGAHQKGGVQHVADILSIVESRAETEARTINLITAIFRHKLTETAAFFWTMR